MIHCSNTPLMRRVFNSRLQSELPPLPVLLISCFPGASKLLPCLSQLTSFSYIFQLLRNPVTRVGTGWAGGGSPSDGLSDEGEAKYKERGVFHAYFNFYLTTVLHGLFFSLMISGYCTIAIISAGVQQWKIPSKHNLSIEEGFLTWGLWPLSPSSSNKNMEKVENRCPRASV